jgi:hypothetical protein
LVAYAETIPADRMTVRRLEKRILERRASTADSAKVASPWMYKDEKLKIIVVWSRDFLC